MPIDIKFLIDKAFEYLPESNLLTDEQMVDAAISVINSVGNDQSKFPEILCKLLGVVADLNMARAPLETEGVVRERLGDHEIEYSRTFDLGKLWKDFKDSLEYICPLFGYKPKYKGAGVRINAGERHDPLCPRSRIPRRRFYHG